MEELPVTIQGARALVIGNGRIGRLLAGKLSVQEVGDAVGYGEQSYFIKVFRKYTGVSPSDYRRIFESFSAN